MTDTWSPEPDHEVNSTGLILKVLEILKTAREAKPPVMTNLEDLIWKMMGTFDEDTWMTVMGDIKKEYSEAM